MLTVFNHVSAFITVVLVNCAFPANWESCVSVHRWVPGYFSDLERFIQEKPYELEQNYLSNFDKNL